MTKNLQAMSHKIRSKENLREEYDYEFNCEEDCFYKILFFTSRI